MHTDVYTDRFTDRAAVYAAARPMHPPASIAFVLEGLGTPARLHIADLGAGTGLSARAFAATGARVSAVEPNAAMRAVADAHPNITPVAAPAEQTTLADTSVDVVTACSAWHWFDHPALMPEIRRILTSRGRLAVLEIRFDESDPFTKAWRDIFRRFETSATRMPEQLDDAVALNPATAVRATFPFAHPLDRAGVHAYTDSSSLAPAHGVAYAAMHTAIDALVDDAGSAPLALRRISTVTRVDR